MFQPVIKWSGSKRSQCENIKSGNSSFKRIKEVAKDAIVYESLYLKVKQEDNDGQS